MTVYTWLGDLRSKCSHTRDILLLAGQPRDIAQPPEHGSYPGRRTDPPEGPLPITPSIDSKKGGYAELLFVSKAQMGKCLMRKAPSLLLEPAGLAPGGDPVTHIQAGETQDNLSYL